MQGLGDSSRPQSGYDKKTIADDIWRMVNGELGHDSFYLVGHDWGGPTAYALAAAHPKAVKRLVIIDVPIPGCGGDFSQGGRRWHHQFHMTLDLPEALTAGREDVLSWFYRTFAYRPDAINDVDLNTFALIRSRVPCAPGSTSIRRRRKTSRTINIARQKLPMPVLAVSGEKSYPHARGRINETKIVEARAVDVRGEIARESGHFVPEEAPDFKRATIGLLRGRQWDESGLRHATLPRSGSLRCDRHGGG